MGAKAQTKAGLLPQPGGFEGDLSVEETPQAHDFVLLEFDQVKDHLLERDAAARTASSHACANQHRVVPLVDELLGRPLPLADQLHESLGPASESLMPAIGGRVRDFGNLVELGVLVHRLKPWGKEHCPSAGASYGAGLVTTRIDTMNARVGGLVPRPVGARSSTVYATERSASHRRSATRPAEVFPRAGVLDAAPRCICVRPGRRELT
jgi:hypothetical protein